MSRRKPDQVLGRPAGPARHARQVISGSPGTPGTGMRLAVEPQRSRDASVGVFCVHGFTHFERNRSNDHHDACACHCLFGVEDGSGAVGTSRSFLLMLGQYWRVRFPPNLHPRSDA
jgi:hypothetical protein